MCVYIIDAYVCIDINIYNVHVLIYQYAYACVIYVYVCIYYMLYVHIKQQRMASEMTQ